jgi:hypothetical protein
MPPPHPLLKCLSTSNGAKAKKSNEESTTDSSVAPRKLFIQTPSPSLGFHVPNDQFTQPRSMYPQGMFPWIHQVDGRRSAPTVPADTNRYMMPSCPTVAAFQPGDFRYGMNTNQVENVAPGLVSMYRSVTNNVGSITDSASSSSLRNVTTNGNTLLPPMQPKPKKPVLPTHGLKDNTTNIVRKKPAMMTVGASKKSTAGATKKKSASTVRQAKPTL